MPLFAHFDTADNCAFQWKIENGKFKIITQFPYEADKKFHVVFDCKSETQPVDNKPDSRTSCENDEQESSNMQSFSAQRAGNPADRVFAQIFQKLGLRASHEDDKNHVTQRKQSRRVDFSLPNQYVTLMEQSDRRDSMVNLRRFFALRAQNDSILVIPNLFRDLTNMEVLFQAGKMLKLASHKTDTLTLSSFTRLVQHDKMNKDCNSLLNYSTPKLLNCKEGGVPCLA